jgi:hypothetical protein
MRAIRRTGMLLCVLVSGCASQSGAPLQANDASPDTYEEEHGGDVNYDFDAPPEPPTGEASQEDKWWEAASPCPPESAIYGGLPPEHDKVGCKTTNGKNAGRLTKFYLSGIKKEEGHYEDHFAEGLFTSWDEQGQKVSESPFVRGKKHGLETIWYPGGGIKSQRPYVEGQRHGVVYIWDDKERKRTAVPYEHGKQHGSEARWDIDGNLARVISWKHGTLVSDTKK